MSNKSIQDNLDKLIKNLNNKYHKKVIIIAHSLGGILTDTYMRLHDDFNDHIIKFISLCTPFDGSGALAVNAMLYSYDLGLPVKNCVMKGT